MAAPTNKPDYSSPSKKKRFVESERRRMLQLADSINSAVETYLGGVFGERRKKAILNYLDRAEKEFGSFGLDSVVEQFVKNELMPMSDYNHLDDDADLRIGAALWVLDKLKANGKLRDAFDILPNISDDIDNWFLPTDFAHPCYANDLIQSVIHLISRRYSEKPVRDVIITEQNANGEKPDAAYENLLKLLPKEDIKAACNAFKTKLWDLETRLIKGQGYYERAIKQTLRQFENTLNAQIPPKSGAPFAAPLYGSPVNSSGMDSIPFFGNGFGGLPNLSSEGRSVLDSMERGQELVEQKQGYALSFDGFLQMDKIELRQEAGRQIAEIIDGFRVDDPYEICFALFYLIDHGDDAPWLIRTGSSLMLYAMRMLPWFTPEYERFDDEYDIWIDGLRYDRNDWLEQDPVAEQIDYYHEKHDGKNLSQVIYELCRTVVPTGLHPFEADRQKLIAEGMDEALAAKITDKAELMFLYQFQARQSIEGEWDVFENEVVPSQEEPVISASEPKIGGYWGKVMGLASSDEPELNDDGTSAKEENERLKTELDTLKRQLKSLRNEMALTRQEANNEKAKYEHELKGLRLEHRELADLRELVFNSERTEEEKIRREKVEKLYSYPYAVKKRTVVFGGHDTWLKAFKPMLSGVKFVDVEQVAFNPELVRNADVVWVQNNCISHSQYGNIVKLTRQYGVQLRYFAYASAEKCAEQLVDWDLA